MKKILDLLSAEVAKAFAAAGYDEKYARVSISNRPDLCEYQCNGAMAAAKEYHKAPIHDCKWSRGAACWFRSIWRSAGGKSGIH